MANVTMVAILKVFLPPLNRALRERDCLSVECKYKVAVG